MLAIFIALATSTVARAQETNLTRHRDFAYDDSAVRQEPNLAALRKAMTQQIDIVYLVGLPPETLAFFQKVPIKLVARENRTGGTPGAYSSQTRSVTVFLNVVGVQSRPVLLHEFMHAYHHQRLPGGNRNADIRKHYERAKTAQTFDVKSYMMSNPQEFFACAATTYLNGVTAQEPFKREKVKADAELFDYLKKMFGLEAGSYVGTIQGRK